MTTVLIFYNNRQCDRWVVNYYDYSINAAPTVKQQLTTSENPIQHTAFPALITIDSAAFTAPPYEKIQLISGTHAVNYNASEFFKTNYPTIVILKYTHAADAEPIDCQILADSTVRDIQVFGITTTRFAFP